MTKINDRKLRVKDISDNFFFWYFTDMIEENSGNTDQEKKGKT